MKLQEDYDPYSSVTGAAASTCGRWGRGLPPLHQGAPNPPPLTDAERNAGPMTDEEFRRWMPTCWWLANGR